MHLRGYAGQIFSLIRPACSRRRTGVVPIGSPSVYTGQGSEVSNLTSEATNLRTAGSERW